MIRCFIALLFLGLSVASLHFRPFAWEAILPSFVGEEGEHPFPGVVLEGIAMTIPYKLLVASSRSERSRVEVILRETFAEIDLIYNRWNGESELSRLNKLAAGEVVALSEPLYLFLRRVGEVVRVTEGRFDPTVEGCREPWKRSLERGETLNQEEIRDLRSSLGWDLLHLERGREHCWKEEGKTSLDLGGIVKGHAVDLLVERLGQAGFSDFYVEWGGEIRTWGMHPEKRPWRVFISSWGDPNPSRAVAIIDMDHRAMATSGDYYQHWRLPNGHLYSHIFDPHTGSPMPMGRESVGSATVLAQNCFLADGIATALLTFPSAEESVLWAEKLVERCREVGDGSVECWISSRAGTWHICPASCRIGS